MYRSLLLFFCIFSLCQFTNAQSLIPNGGFESYSICPIGFSEFSGKVNNWLNPNASTPDFMHSCANPNPAGVPKNGVGYQQTHGGNGYAGIYTFSGTIYREFMQVQFTSPLIAGHTYQFSMYTVLHNRSNTAIDDIGAYISVIKPTSGGTGMLTGAPLPQISNPFGSVITDTLQWTLISGNYIASGGEKYVTIGHLKGDAGTTYQTLPYGSVGAYYYFDDVELIDITLLPLTLLQFSGEPVNNEIGTENILRWSTGSELNTCCFIPEKSAGGIDFTSFGSVESAGNSNTQQDYVFYDQQPYFNGTYYRLQLKDDDGSFSYSNTIFINNSADIHMYTMGDQLYISNAGGIKLQICIYALNGQKILSELSETIETILQLPDLNQGLYLVTIQNYNNQQILFTDRILL